MVAGLENLYARENQPELKAEVVWMRGAERLRGGEGLRRVLVHRPDERELCRVVVLRLPLANRGHRVLRARVTAVAVDPDECSRGLDGVPLLPGAALRLRDERIEQNVFLLDVAARRRRQLREER